MENSLDLEKCGQVRSGPVRSGQVRSGQVRSGQVRSGQVRSGQVRSGQVRSGQVIFSKSVALSVSYILCLMKIICRNSMMWRHKKLKFS
jgi:hypothetical protein